MRVASPCTDKAATPKNVHEHLELNIASMYHEVIGSTERVPIPTTDSCVLVWDYCVLTGFPLSGLAKHDDMRLRSWICVLTGVGFWVSTCFSEVL